MKASDRFAIEANWIEDHCDNRHTRIERFSVTIRRSTKADAASSKACPVLAPKICCSRIKCSLRDVSGMRGTKRGTLYYRGRRTLEDELELG
jgi:hypothetical protein